MINPMTDTEETLINPARKKLLEFIADKGWSDKATAAAFDCAPSYVCGLKNGTVTPGLSLAARIEEVTGIPCSDWVKDKPSKKRRQGQYAR